MAEARITDVAATCSRCEADIKISSLVDDEREHLCPACEQTRRIAG